MRIKNESLTLDGTDMTSNIVSDPVWLGHIAHYAIQLVYTGSPNGTFTLEASNDEGSKTNDIANVSITNWTTVSGSSTAVSAAGDLMYNITDAGYKWVRLVWTDSTSASTPTMTVYRYNLKGV